MAGLKPLADEALPDELKDWTATPVASVARAFGHHPELWRAWWGFYGEVMKDGAVSMKLKEIVRLRIASLNGCSV
jgi:alkylhydroperoxidase family enzyme